MQGILYVRS